MSPPLHGILLPLHAIIIYTMMWSMVSCYKFTLLFCSRVGCFCQLRLTSYVSSHSAYSEYHRKDFFSKACANHFLLPFEELAKLVLNLGEVFLNHSWKPLLVCLNHFWNSSGRSSSQPWIVTVDFWSWGSMSLTSLFQYAGLLHSPGPAVNTAVQKSTKQNTPFDSICLTAGIDQHRLPQLARFSYIYHYRNKLHAIQMCIIYHPHTWTIPNIRVFNWV